MTALFPPAPSDLVSEATAIEPEPPERSPSALFRGLLARGLSADEAGNLTARLLGLDVVLRRAWTVHEIEHLVFLRSLAASGRLDRRVG
ncbi:MAG TPA: hypothetical protein VH720_06705 [Candidatus Limnocylindrales bacterium]|jgi:hypothetical protein